MARKRTIHDAPWPDAVGEELAALDGPGRERTGRHGQHGELTIELYEPRVAAEEVDHLAQIARPL